MRIILCLAIGLAVTPFGAAAQEFDDPAIVVCELLARAHFEIQSNSFERIAARVDGTTAVIDFQWGALGAAPKAEMIVCPYHLVDGRYELDVPVGQQASIAPAEDAIAASGLYPIPPSETALQ